MAHVLPARAGRYGPRPHSSPRQWSWHLITGIDTAAGIGMLLIGTVASGPAAIVAIAFGCLVLVESGRLSARLIIQAQQASRLDYRPR